MKLIEKKIQKDTIVNISIISFGFTALFSIIQLPVLTNQMAENGVMFIQVMSAFFSFLVYEFIITLPIAVILGILLVAVRLHVDNELTIITMATGSKHVFLELLLKLAIVILILQAILLFFLIPWALGFFVKMMFDFDKVEILFNSLQNTGLPSKLFGTNLNFFTYRLIDDEIRGLIFLQNKEDSIDYFFMNNAKINSLHELVLNDIRFISFKAGELYKNGKIEDIIVSPKATEMTIRKSLLLQSTDIIDLLKNRTQDNIYEIHFRINQMISLCVAIFMSLIFINFKPRQARVQFVFLWSLLIYMIYFSGEFYFLELIKKGALGWEVYFYQILVLALCFITLFKKKVN